MVLTDYYALVHPNLTRTPALIDLVLALSPISNPNRIRYPNTNPKPQTLAITLTLTLNPNS